MKRVKVLIVDDDSYMHLLYKKIFPLEFFTCSFAIDGKAALEMYAKEQPDLIILDMMLPILPGYLVLRRIRKNNGDSTTKIIVSTSLASKSDIMACTRLGIQGYIIKPFDFREIRQRIMTMFALNDSIPSLHSEPSASLPKKAPVIKPREVIKRDVAAFEAGNLSKNEVVMKILSISKSENLDLPSMPQIVFKIQEAMERQETSTKHLAEILTTDQGLCAKLVGLSNSAFYRGGRKCTTVDEAILRVGLDETKELAFVLANRGLYAMKDPRFENDLLALFRHSVACGVVARLLAERLKQQDTYSSFTFGILHDIGKLLMIKIFSETYKNDHQFDLNSIRRITQQLHNYAGSIFIASLGFPKETTNIILHHNNLEQNLTADDTQLAIISFANLVVKKLGYGASLAKENDIFDTPAGRHLGLEVEILDTAAQRIETYFNILGAMA